jgi:hypothetical protein
VPKFGYFESVQSYLQRRNAAPSCDLGLPDDRRCQNASRKAKVERAAHASAERRAEARRVRKFDAARDGCSDQHT